MSDDQLEADIVALAKRMAKPVAADGISPAFIAYDDGLALLFSESGHLLMFMPEKSAMECGFDKLPLLPDAPR